MIKYGIHIKRKAPPHDVVTVGQGYLQNDVMFYFVGGLNEFGKMMSEEVILELFEIVSDD